MRGYTQPLLPAAAFGPAAETTWPMFRLLSSEPEVSTEPPKAS